MNTEQKSKNIFTYNTSLPGASDCPCFIQCLISTFLVNHSLLPSMQHLMLVTRKMIKATLLLTLLLSWFQYPSAYQRTLVTFFSIDQRFIRHTGTAFPLINAPDADLI